MSADQREEASMKMNSRASFSRRRLALGFAAILAFTAVPAFAGGKCSAGEHPAKQFLGSIYQRYLGKSSAAATGIALANGQSVRSYFTAGLASLILDDRTAATERGESPKRLKPFSLSASFAELAEGKAISSNTPLVSLMK